MPREPKSKLRERAVRISDVLRAEYPDATTALDHEDAFELLIATILAAQCTDARVNLTTPELFRRWPDAKAMAKAKPKEMEGVVKSCGFYRNKAKNVIAASQQIVAKHAGEVPATMEELTALPGVARKTANVVLGTVFRKAVGVVVDTHCQRVSRRLLLTKADDPVKIERDLMDALPQERWTEFGHELVYHGRQVCHARKPRCPDCVIRQMCPSRQDVPNPRPLPGKYDVKPAPRRQSAALA